MYNLMNGEMLLFRNLGQTKVIRQTFEINMFPVLLTSSQFSCNGLSPSKRFREQNSRRFEKGKIDYCVSVCNQFLKMEADTNLTYTMESKTFSLNEIAKLYSSVKSPDSFASLKCFIEIAYEIIPVFHLEEADAYTKVTQINLTSKSRKCNRQMKMVCTNVYFLISEFIPTCGWQSLKTMS